MTSAVVVAATLTVPSPSATAAGRSLILPTARAPWITAQSVVSGSRGPTTTLTIAWPRTRGARSYSLLYANSRNPARSSSLRVRRGIPATRASLQKVVLSGLAPGRTYCFQVKARAGRAAGRPSAAHCKVTMPAARKLAPTNFALKIATFNVCGRAKTCQRWPWTTRRPLVAQHIAMSGADVVAIQEGRLRMADIKADLANAGFAQACVAAGAQALFVRTSVYSVVAKTTGGLRFAGDLAHGACWARLRHKPTKSEVVVTSIHLYVGEGTAASRARDAQTSQVLGAMQQKFGAIGATGTPSFVLAGDFNSHRSHRVDSPRVRLGKAGFADAYDVSATYQNPYRSSANRYRPVPVKSFRWGSHVDRVFVPRGVSVTGWRTVSQVRNGRYVTPMPSDHYPVAVTAYLPVTTAPPIPAPTCTLIIFCS